MIDSTLFAIDIPAGTYAAGDKLQLNCISGPANVRSGRGAAILKRILAGSVQPTPETVWQLDVKNSDWIDDASALAAPLISYTALDEHSASIRDGNSCQLTENSSWSVVATCIVGGTSTKAETVFGLIDVDYPSVSAIVDPDTLVGIPTSIKFNKTGTKTHKVGSAAAANWVVQSVDQFKAGFKYALQEMNYSSGTTQTCGFVRLSNAAGMGGLSRIVPVTSQYAAIRQTIRYASLLVKGPMDISLMLFNTTTSDSTADIYLIQDFVKRAQ